MSNELIVNSVGGNSVTGYKFRFNAPLMPGFTCVFKQPKMLEFMIVDHWQWHGIVLNFFFWEGGRRQHESLPISIYTTIKCGIAT